MVANYTNKHVTFNKGQCTGHMEPSINKMSQTSVISVITQKMMDDHIQLDTFTLPLHHLSSEVQSSLDELLDSFKSQFVKDETSIGTTNLTKIQIDTGNSDLVSKKPYPFAMKYYVCARDEINMLLDAKVICNSHSSWSAPIIVVPKGNGRNGLIINYIVPKKVTQKFIWPMPKVNDILSKLNGLKYFATLDL